MAYTKEYFETNRDAINARRRAKYCSAQRKEQYERNRVEILQKQKEDRAVCEMCGKSVRRLYVHRHVATRHCLPAC